MAEDSNVYNSVLDWLYATSRSEQAEKWREIMEEEEIESNPSVQLREDITEARLALPTFDHDKFDECKEIVSMFLVTYRSYFAWVKSLPAGHSKSKKSTVDGHYWFKHFRKLVKQTAFALLLKSMNMTIETLPDEADLADFSEHNPTSFKFKTYESQVSTFYTKCIKNWVIKGSDDEEEQKGEDEQIEEAHLNDDFVTELQKDLNYMLDIRKEVKAVSWPKIFLKIDDNRSELVHASSASQSSSQDSGEDPRRFIKNVVTFLTETEGRSLGKPILAEVSSHGGLKAVSAAADANADAHAHAHAHAHAEENHLKTKIPRKKSSSSSSSSSSAAASVTNDAVREATRLRELAMRKPSLPPKGSKPTGRSISGPRESAHAISPIDDDDRDEDGDDDAMAVEDKDNDDDDVDDDDEDGALGMKKAIVKAKGALSAADGTRIASKKRNFKNTLKENAGDDDDDENRDSEVNDPTNDPVEDRDSDVEAVTISRKKTKSDEGAVKKVDGRVKSEEERKTRKRNPCPSDRELLGKKSPNGNPSRKRINWTFDEEQSLIEGLKVHGTEYAEILNDPRFGASLSRRTNVDLKDKYRILRKNGAIDLGDREPDWRKKKGRAYAIARSSSKGDNENDEN